MFGAVIQNSIMDMNSIHQNFGTCHCLWELKVSKLFKYFTKNVNVFYYLDSKGLKRFFVATTPRKSSIQTQCLLILIAH